MCPIQSLDYASLFYTLPNLKSLHSFTKSEACYLEEQPTCNCQPDSEFRWLPSSTSNAYSCSPQCSYRTQQSYARTGKAQELLLHLTN